MQYWCEPNKIPDLLLPLQELTTSLRTVPVCACHFAGCLWLAWMLCPFANKHSSQLTTILGTKKVSSPIQGQTWVTLHYIMNSINCNGPCLFLLRRWKIFALTRFRPCYTNNSDKCVKIMCGPRSTSLENILYCDFVCVSEYWCSKPIVALMPLVCFQMKAFVCVLFH